MKHDYAEQEWSDYDMVSNEAKASWAIVGIVLGVVAIVALGTKYYDNQKVVKEITNCQNIIAWEFDKSRGIYPAERQGYPARNAAEHEFCLYGEK